MSGATDFPAVWLEAVSHIEPARLPRPTIKLQRSRKAKCWLATFWKVDGMPEGVPLPLPYTLQAGVFVVVSDIEARFPSAQVFVN